MKYLLVVLAFLLISCADTRIEEMIFTSVKVNVSNVTNGSGFIVKSDETGSWIVTASHVLKYKDKEIKVKVYPSKKSYVATIVASNEELDVSLLKINEQLKPARLSFENKKVFTKVYAVGAGTGFDPYPTEGLVALNTEKWLIITASIEYGKSGGAVFTKNGLHYEVIGMIHAVGVKQGFFEKIPIWHQVYAVPMRRMQEFLANNNIGVDK